MLRLTPASSTQSGAAYSTNAISLGSNATFSTTFSFRFTSPSNPPADGITFVLAAGTSGLGSSGGGLGYVGVNNSVAVEFDTFSNGSADASSSNHVAIDTNGVLTDTAAAFPYGLQNCNASGAGYMSNGDLWSVTIGYNATDLSVAMQDAANPVDNIISNYAINIASYLGTNNAYVGFTGGTGGSYENQALRCLVWVVGCRGAARGRVPDLPEPGAARSPGEVRPGRRNGSPAELRNTPGGPGWGGVTHTKQRGGENQDITTWSFSNRLRKIPLTSPQRYDSCPVFR